MAELTFPIETSRLRLRPFTPADVDAVHAYQSLEEVARYQYWEPRSREEVAAEVAKWMEPDGTPEAPLSMVFAVTLKDSGALIGDMVLLFRDWEARQGELGFSFNPAFAGRGYATEAATAVMDLGFGHFGLHRIFGRCDARNDRSWALMQRLGMRREAHFREHARFKGVWDEEFYYAMLAREWADLRRGEA
ncbi:acetyltransferase [Hoeflea sp. BAL378]|uniref:GNAT family N-acetyltransferase n=1 Tax=Hoeflea sp. BAL378 TaxID=1547437 RepID=UPI000514314B|nr:GNAT family N-acetyltransferase [Hoeflea sp. BAL378]KGF67987.1 acetyltransferase [Hoeflea sp. BAL378]